MPKDIPQPVNPPEKKNNHVEHEQPMKQPLSGSKKVKNQNHSRQNHGEGS